MKNVKKELLQFLFSGTTLRRWNGFVHPIELTEVDRQSHKMIIAWFIYMLEAPKYSATETIQIYQELIESALFDYCLNLVITDIKPNVYERIRKNKEHHDKIIQWGMKSFATLLEDVDPALYMRAKKHLLEPKVSSPANEILRSAALYSTLWEFRLLKSCNTFSPELEIIEKSLYQDIEMQCEKVPSFSTILPSGYKDTPLFTNALSEIIYTCGQLRFQKRWSQVPRLPETNVLGHTFLVACFSYLFSITLDSSTVRSCNAFFTGIFHDLPELLTQDIITPVKYSSQEITKIIKEYEDFELAQKIFNPLEEEAPRIVSSLKYFLGTDLGSEFYEGIMDNNIPIRVTFTDLQEKYNKDTFNPKDGTLIKICDNLSALLEASISIENGVHPPLLVEAKERIISSILDRKFISNTTEEDKAGIEKYLMPQLLSIIDSITNQNSKGNI